MRRISCPERDDWQSTAAAMGFHVHTIGGERYWDESAYYAFSLDEIERDIEAPTAEIEAMCRELVSDDRYLRLLKIPEPFWTHIAASWKRAIQASMAVLISLSTERHGRNCWNTMPIHRHRCSKQRFPMDMARTGHRTADHTNPRRSI